MSYSVEGFIDTKLLWIMRKNKKYGNKKYKTIRKHGRIDRGEK
jgi:hypothetical protein